MYMCGVYNSESAPKTDSTDSCRSGYLLPDFSSTNCCWLMVEGWDGVGSSRDECAQGETVWWISCTRNWSGSRSRERGGFRRMFGLFAPITVAPTFLTNREDDDDEFKE